MPAHHTNDSESLLFRTPIASQGQGGALGEAEARRRGNTVGIRDQAMDLAKLQGYKVSREANNLPTPTVIDQYTANLSSTQQKPGSMHSVTLAQVFHKTDLFPTPVASEGTKAPSQQTSATKSKTGQVWLSNVAKDLEPLLPTLTASDWKNANHSGSGSASSRSMATAVEQTNWGKFEPAIRRWEATIGRQAPEPTKPDGKEGNHRLSSKFTEWMMGLPDGWITDIGLKRNDELKACGNGVVPQQAELALSLLGIKEILERN